MSNRSDVSYVPPQPDAGPDDFAWWVHEIDPFHRLSPPVRQARARAARRHWLADNEAAAIRCRLAESR
ncbi:hypothetical protein CcI49_14575 [Frankia sp. CcI49]|uniref:Uncharacterized protein n=1 Tax=Parafrankia irregularis TaxID=795642 RepID=A0A0S4QN53_9ACTN|nr:MULTISPECIES: hypothetical protein [Frankiaceae]EFC86019.1 hypothetical protein FrEUN1fDRAFT_0809 [Parafrankia sp. EUN1f]KPM52361.1 hypothetical protein ACG83_28665 [Frankia sp. R43]MBE3206006.1 hypothetical protein [Parafrankia sp. CH37]ONH59935.1 hypothetical protein CcI49_14575 [Frankia sp. CcI49]CUU57115.1 hypothetical protein Ga0074812_110130 [Parafrankia irregularis]